MELAKRQKTAGQQLVAFVSSCEPDADHCGLDPAERLAEEEGLTLVRSSRCISGFQNVKFSASRGESKPFQLCVNRRALGRYASASEAALAYARLLGPIESARAAVAREPMTAEEVHQAVAAEGLTLVPSQKGDIGFAGITRVRSRAADGKQAFKISYASEVSSEVCFCAYWQNKYLGSAATALEAALLYARQLGPNGSAEAAATEKSRSTERMTAEQAEAQAEAEGLTLVRSVRNKTGFAGVYPVHGSREQTGRFAVSYRGRHITGRCLSAEEAALIYARTLGTEQSAAQAAVAAAEAASLTLEDVEEIAAAEGLTLARSATNKSGFKYVKSDPRSQREGYHGCRPYQVFCRPDNVYLSAATPHEAALLLARRLGPEGSAQTAAEAQSMTAEEALQLAADEGLTLVRSVDNPFGFKGIALSHGRFKADVAGHYFGGGATPEEAALCYARYLGPAGSAAEGAKMQALWAERQASKEAEKQAKATIAAACSMTAEEALRLASAEGLTLVRSQENKFGFKGVYTHNDKGTGHKCTCFQARLGGKYLGGGATPEEAALAYARHLGPAGSAKASAAEAPAAKEAAAKEKAAARESAAAAKRAAANAANAAKAAANAVAKATAKAALQAAVAQQRQAAAAAQKELLRQAALKMRQATPSVPPGGPRMDSASSAGSHPTATEEALDQATIEALVARALGDTDPFTRLWLPACTSREGCRKRYLQLARRLHPDKTAHPQASAAFRAVEEAFRLIEGSSSGEIAR